VNEGDFELLNCGPKGEEKRRNVKGFDFGCVSKLSVRIILITEKFALRETLGKKSTRILYLKNKGY